MPRFRGQLQFFVVALVVSFVNTYISIFVLHRSANPYSVRFYFVIAALTWLGMSIANNAIQTARTEAQKNAAIFNGVAGGVVVLNEQNQVVLANPAALTAHGERQQELRGRVLAFEWSEVNGVGRVAMVRDISRQLEIEHARDAMLGVVSHEMRTPLAAIIGFAEVIGLRPDAASELAGRIHANAQRLIYMVDDLLDHPQAQAGVLKIKSEQVSLYGLKQAITKLVERLISEKHL